MELAVRCPPGECGRNGRVYYRFQIFSGGLFQTILGFELLPNRLEHPMQKAASFARIEAKGSIFRTAGLQPDSGKCPERARRLVFDQTGATAQVRGFGDRSLRIDNRIDGVRDEARALEQR